MFNFELSEKQIAKLKGIKQKIVLSHKQCNGEGYIYTKDHSLMHCMCMQVLGYVANLIYSNIPLDYWQLSLKNLALNEKVRIIINLYYDNFKNAIENGKGLFLASATRGVGKTSVACELAKKAITLRLEVYYDLLSNIIDNSFTDDKQIIERIKNSDVIIVDELDKIMMKENSPLKKKIDSFFRSLLPLGKTIIVCSNSTLEEIEKEMQLGSLLRRYLKIIEFEGTDYSGKKNEEIDKQIQQGYNYFHPNIVNMAKEYYKNEYIDQERLYNEHFKIYE